MPKHRDKPPSGKVVSLAEHVEKKRKAERVRALMELGESLDQAGPDPSGDDGASFGGADFSAMQANMLAAEGMRKEALAAWDRAIALSPEPTAKLFVSRAHLHAELGHHREAFVDCSRAIELDRNSARAHAVRGMCRGSLGHDEQLVMADLDRAVQLAPDDWECRYFRGHVLAELCRFAEAFADFDHAVTQRPDMGVLYEERGAARARIDDDDDRDPIDSEKESKARIEASLADFDKALELGRRSAELYVDKATLLQMRGDNAGALEVLDQGVAALPNEGFIFSSRSDVKRVLHDETGAAADRAKAAELGYGIRPD